MVPDQVDLLLRGVRGRRLCLEYASLVDEAVRTAVFWLARGHDPNPGTLLRMIGDVPDRREDPTLTPQEVATSIDRIPPMPTRKGTVRDALRATVDLARYWQEPDGSDAVASLPPVRRALRPIAERLVEALPDLSVSRAAEQWAVDWRALGESGPLPTDPAALLADWTTSVRLEEERA